MLRFGTISNVDVAKGLARVKWDDDEIVSGWLHVSCPKTQDDKVSFPFDIGEHVWCTVDEHSEAGVIGGAIYSTADTPPAEAGADKLTVKFKDGTLIEYDRAAHQLKIKVENSEHIITRTGHTIKRSSESLKKIISDLIDTILAETHMTGTGPSSTPINAAAYTAIKNRLPNLFEN